MLNFKHYLLSLAKSNASAPNHIISWLSFRNYEWSIVATLEEALSEAASSLPCIIVRSFAIRSIICVSTFTHSISKCQFHGWTFSNRISRFRINLIHTRVSKCRSIICHVLRNLLMTLTCFMIVIVILNRMSLFFNYFIEHSTHG